MTRAGDEHEPLIDLPPPSGPPVIGPRHGSPRAAELAEAARQRRQDTSFLMVLAIVVLGIVGVGIVLTSLFYLVMALTAERLF